jgi:hypothetical protein
MDFGEKRVVAKFRNRHLDDGGTEAFQRRPQEIQGERSSEALPIELQPNGQSFGVPDPNGKHLFIFKRLEKHNRIPPVILGESPDLHPEKRFIFFWHYLILPNDRWEAPSTDY